MEYVNVDDVTSKEEYAVRIELADGSFVYTTGVYGSDGVLNIEAIPGIPEITPVCESNA